MNFNNTIFSAAASQWEAQRFHSWAPPLPVSVWVLSALPSQSNDIREANGESKWSREVNVSMNGTCDDLATNAGVTLPSAAGLGSSWPLWPWAQEQSGKED